MRSIWKKRCEIVHGSNGKKISRRERKALKKEILQQFELGPNGLRADEEDLLNRTPSQVLGYSLKN